MAPDIVEGEEFKGGARQLTMTRLLAFSGGPFAAPGWPAKNLHTDVAKAAEAGLGGPIASGVQCEGDIIALMMELFGEAWLRHGRLHVMYPRPVFAGTWVQARARIRGRRPTDDGSFVELDVWCETSEGVKVVVGTASCLEQPTGMSTRP